MTQRNAESAENARLPAREASRGTEANTGLIGEMTQAMAVMTVSSGNIAKRAIGWLPQENLGSALVGTLIISYQGTSNNGQIRPGRFLRRNLFGSGCVNSISRPATANFLPLRRLSNLTIP